MLRLAIKALENIEIDEMKPKDILEFIKYAAKLEWTTREKMIAETAETKQDDRYIEALINATADDWSEWGEGMANDKNLA